jgi:hypothetical protein
MSVAGCALSFISTTFCVAPTRESRKVLFTPWPAHAGPSVRRTFSWMATSSGDMAGFSAGGLHPPESTNFMPKHLVPLLAICRTRYLSRSPCSHAIARRPQRRGRINYPQTLWR